MGTRTPSRRQGDLYELRSLEYAPLAADAQRVDRQKKIIFGVKVVGRASPNMHGEPGATRGTIYTPEALRDAATLYEGVSVNVNHPPPDKRVAGAKFDRPAQDRIGKLYHVRLIDGELYGDLHLIPSHGMTESLLDAAADPKLQSCYALSHNARGDGPIEGGVWKITQIGSVKSVDLVADGGTNKSLFEGKEPVAKVKLKDLCESKPELKKKLKPLFKLFEAAGDMLVEGEEGESGGDYRDHLHAAQKMCEDQGDSEMAGKIHGMLKPKKEDEGEETEESEEDDDAPKGGEGAGGDDKSKMESRLVELEAKDACRELCESLAFAPSKLQLKAMIQLSAADRKEFVKELKTKGGAGAARSRSLIPAPKAGGAAGDVTESAEDGGVPQKADDQLAWLRG